MTAEFPQEQVKCFVRNLLTSEVISRHPPLRIFRWYLS